MNLKKKMENNKMKNNKKYYITLTVITITIIIVTTLIVNAKTVNVSGGGSCSINNIEYVDVSPLDCWMGGINSTFCPLPHDISCSGNGNIPLSIGLINMALEQLE